MPKQLIFEYIGEWEKTPLTIESFNWVTLSSLGIVKGTLVYQTTWTKYTSDQDCLSKIWSLLGWQYKAANSGQAVFCNLLQSGS